MYRIKAFQMWAEDQRATAVRTTGAMVEPAVDQEWGKPPSVRTLSRWKKAFLALPPAERYEYGVARWPDAMEAGALPWEASASLMELLAHTLPNGAPPSVKWARWHYRVSLAVPDACPDDRLRVSGYLADIEEKDAITDEDRRVAEALLVEWSRDTR